MLTLLTCLCVLRTLRDEHQHCHRSIADRCSSVESSSEVLLLRQCRLQSEQSNMSSSLSTERIYFVICCIVSYVCCACVVVAAVAVLRCEIFFCTKKYFSLSFFSQESSDSSIGARFCLKHPLEKKKLEAQSSSDKQLSRAAIINIRAARPFDDFQFFFHSFHLPFVIATESNLTIISFSYKHKHNKWSSTLFSLFSRALCASLLSHSALCTPQTKVDSSHSSRCAASQSSHPSSQQQQPTDWLSFNWTKKDGKKFRLRIIAFFSLSWILFANLLCSRAAASPPKLPASVKIALKCAISNREYISSNNTFELRWAFSDSTRYLSVFLFHFSGTGTQKSWAKKI